MANKDLLPPDDGLLLPPDDSGAGSQGLAGAHDDVFDQMSEKVAAGARLLGAKAAELKAAQGPVLKEQTQKLGAKMIDAAAQARDRAEEAAREASATLQDPSRRNGFWRTYKRRILAGAGAFVLLVAGGYGFGCYKATGMARDAIDTYLIRNHLQQVVTYRDVSATPFGAARLSGVKIAAPNSGPTLEVASLSISGLKPDGGVPDRLDVDWSGLSLPSNGLMSGDELAGFVGSGFARLQGEGSFQWRANASAREVEIKSSGKFSGACAWDFDVAFANIDPASLGRLGDGGIMSVLAVQLGMSPLLAIQLKSLSGSLDMSDLVKRASDIPHTALPAGDGYALFEKAPAEFGRSLIEAGMSPSDARDTADALQKFARTGARITLKSRVEHPVPLFSVGGFGQPQLTSFPAFLAATKLSLSN